MLLPFLASRLLYAGTGAIRVDRASADFVLSERAELIRLAAGPHGDGVQRWVDWGARPLARAGASSRVHVVGGEANRSEMAALLKVGATALVVRMLDEAPHLIADMSLADPATAVRQINRDLTGREPVTLEGGRRVSTLDVQTEFLDAVRRFASDNPTSADERQVLSLWESCLEALAKGDRIGWLDWVTKLKHIESNVDELTDPVATEIDHSFTAVYPRPSADATTGTFTPHPVVPEADIVAAMTVPPASTRAHLRGTFIEVCKQARRDYSVNWTELRLNDGARQTVSIDDPLVATDQKVEDLIAEIRGGARSEGPGAFGA